MNERTRILSDGRNRAHVAVSLPKTAVGQLMSFLAGKFDAVADFVYKWTTR